MLHSEWFELCNKFPEDSRTPANFTTFPSNCNIFIFVLLS